MVEVIAIGVAFLGIWGSLWYKVGKLTSEVKGHNLKLTEIQKAMERLLQR